MLVNKIPFLVTKSRKIHFGTVKTLQNQKAVTIMKAMKKVNSVYHRNGFQISVMLMDGQSGTMTWQILVLL